MGAQRSLRLLLRWSAYILGKGAHTGEQRVRVLDRSDQSIDGVRGGGRNEKGAEMRCGGSTVVLIKCLPVLIASVVFLYIEASSSNR